MHIFEGRNTLDELGVLLSLAPGVHYFWIISIYSPFVSACSSALKRRIRATVVVVRSTGKIEPAFRIFCTSP